MFDNRFCDWYVDDEKYEFMENISTMKTTKEVWFRMKIEVIDPLLLVIVLVY